MYLQIVHSKLGPCQVLLIKRLISDTTNCYDKRLDRTKYLKINCILQQ